MTDDADLPLTQLDYLARRYALCDDEIARADIDQEAIIEIEFIAKTNELYEKMRDYYEERKRQERNYRGDH